MIGALMGGAGGLSASASSSSGPASTGGYDASWQYNGQMQIGKGSQDAAATQSAAGGLSPTLLYVGAGLVAVALLAVAYAGRRR